MIKTAVVPTNPNKNAISFGPRCLERRKEPRWEAIPNITPPTLARYTNPIMVLPKLLNESSVQRSKNAGMARIGYNNHRGAPARKRSAGVNKSAARIPTK